LNVLETVLENQQSEQAEHRRRYAELIRRGDDPKKGDAAELAGIMAALNVTPEQARKDLAVIQEARRLEALAAPELGECLRGEIGEAGQALASYREESARIAREREAQEGRLHGILFTATRRRSDWSDSAEKLALVRRKNWRLLGCPEPGPLPTSMPYQGPSGDNPNKS
jgi:hypothetical protein